MYKRQLGKRKILYSWRLTEADKMPEGKRADLSLREKAVSYTHLCLRMLHPKKGSPSGRNAYPVTEKMEELKKEEKNDICLLYTSHSEC